MFKFNTCKCACTHHRNINAQHLINQLMALKNAGLVDMLMKKQQQLRVAV
jgi:hypothetical protein